MLRSGGLLYQHRADHVAKNVAAEALMFVEVTAQSSTRAQRPSSASPELRMMLVLDAVGPCWSTFWLLCVGILLQGFGAQPGQPLRRQGAFSTEDYREVGLRQGFEVARSSGTPCAH